jgi:hypothetical protein
MSKKRTVAVKKTAVAPTDEALFAAVRQLIVEGREQVA